jgi:hypothetical protein
MTEQNNNNPVAGGQEGTEKLDDEFLPDDARPLCRTIAITAIPTRL